MEKEELTPFDPAKLLQSDEARTIFMEDALECGDAGYIANALGVVNRARMVIRWRRGKFSVKNSA